MYKIKKEIKQLLKNKKITNRKIYQISGISENYVSQLINGRAITKIVAYAFTKAVDNDSEISDFFENIEEN